MQMLLSPFRKSYFLRRLQESGNINWTRETCKSRVLVMRPRQSFCVCIGISVLSCCSEDLRSMSTVAVTFTMMNATGILGRAWPWTRGRFVSLIFKKGKKKRKGIPRALNLGIYLDPWVFRGYPPVCGMYLWVLSLACSKYHCRLS